MSHQSDPETERLFRNFRWNEIKIDNAKLEELRDRIFEFAIEHPDRVMLEDLCSRVEPPEKYRAQLSSYARPDSEAKVKDWMLRRWLILAAFDVEKAFHSTVATYEFRRQYSVCLLNDPNKVLPQEFYNVAPLFMDCHDRDGCPVVIVRVNLYRRIPVFDSVLKTAMLHIIDKFDREYEKEPFHGLKIVLDMSDFNYFRDGNLDLLDFFVKLLARYAGLFEKVFIYELSWTLSFLIALAKKASNYITGLKGDHIHSVNARLLQEMIAPEQLPAFMKGGRKQFAQPYPPQAIPFSVLAKNNGFYEMPDKSIDAVYKLLDSVIEQDRAKLGA